MKVLLIHPPNKFLKQAYGVQHKVKFGHAPPLGIGYIASYLEEEGHEVKILDASALELSLEETVARIMEFGPELVGLSVLTNYADSAKLLSERIKKKMPEITVVLGGPHATYFFKDVLDEMPGIDHVLYGEADATIQDYVRFLREPSKLEGLKGLVYRGRDGKPVVNEPADVVQDLDSIPMPAWHLYDMALYRPLPFQYRKMPFFSMITSRGCWWRRCKFCFQAGYRRVHFRRQSAKRVIAEVESLYHNYGIREIAFWDDTFIMNLQWLKEFAALLSKKRLDISWTASGRVNTMDEDIIRAVYEGGCWSMFIGVESGNQSLLDVIEKGITLEQARNVFSIANRVGIETRGAFMLGLPGETPEMGRRTIEFALELNPTYAIFYATHPRYGTELYDIALEYGSFLDKDFRGMSKITYVPEGYKDASELAEMVRSGYKRFYLRPQQFYKFLRKVRSIGELKELLMGVLLYLGLSDAR
jgi:radical SAM superfamily enzyme YgiQ (UPF0313 family)